MTVHAAKTREIHRLRLNFVPSVTKKTQSTNVQNVGAFIAQSDAVKSIKRIVMMSS